MLELKNLTRTYKPKKGVPVQALKNVSLSFEDKGMVFVLGKSGSGKSTLLNLIGGLDFADSGEIIIDGKSSKDFKEKDYDSYRNTYIGFVFQEYNILNEFTVGENITLALELQSQKGDTGRLEEILKEVDLEGYGDRKPNELSGGQKQRVAIARAIIKNPKIVMADEPTGALDSEIGKAIFDTLKRLSQDRLVIVVSHDREFAEEYGDRIIELADGEVISDETKVKAQGERDAETNNLESVAGDTAPSSGLKKSRLPYKRALAMGAKSMRTKPIRLAITIVLCIISFAFFGLADTIASYNTNKATVNSIMANDYDTLAITSGVGALSKDIEYLKDVTGIEFNGVASFSDGGQSLPVVYNKRVKGSSGLDVYYNLSLQGYLPAEKIIDGKKYKLIAGEMPKADYEIVVSKYIYEQFALGGIRLTDGEEIIYVEPEEISALEDFVNKAYVQLETPEGGIAWKVVGVVDTLEDPQGRYASLKPNAKRKGMTAEQYEILAAECSNYFNFSYHSIGFVTQKVYDEIRALRCDTSLKGVSAKGSFTLNNSEKSYTTSFKNVCDDSCLKDLEVEWIDGKPRSALDDDEFVIGSNMLAAIGKDVSDYTQVDYNEKFFDGLVDFSHFNFTLSSLKDFGGLYIGCCQYAESADETQIKVFQDFINSLGSEKDEETRQMIRALAIRKCLDGLPNLKEDYQIDPYEEEFSQLQWRMFYAGYLMVEQMNFYDFIQSIDGGYVTNVAGGLCGKEIKEQVGLELYNKYLLKEINSKTYDGFKVEFYYGNEFGLNDAPKIVGVYKDVDSSKTDKYLINNLVFEKAQKALNPEYAFLIAPMTKDKQTVQKLVDMNYAKDGNGAYVMQNSVMLAMQLKGSTFASLGNVFLYVGLALAVFSIVLMSNYITAAVSSQKRQIGILRALGARSADIFAIFSSESIIIAVVNFVLATVSAFVASIAINAQVASGFGLQITFMLFGIRQIALILALSVGVSLFASVVSIYAISKRKPVDCILDK
ncbi:MAG: ABC transporter ATP-binding protein/permease [Clostridia bacterium]|nr:ABC transporter ATP-binding protein/permease [Clostridia bacterium]